MSGGSNYRQPWTIFPGNMHQTRVPQLTTVELIDALEAGITAMRGRTSGPASSGEPPIPAATLLAEMDRAAISGIELARTLDLPYEILNDWIDGRTAIPGWIITAIRLIAQLPQSARRKAISGSPANGRAHTNRTHPFSRIEDL